MMPPDRFSANSGSRNIVAASPSEPFVFHLPKSSRWRNIFQQYYVWLAVPQSVIFPDCRLKRQIRRGRE
jgi:hypothetical protein